MLNQLTQTGDDSYSLFVADTKKTIPNIPWVNVVDTLKANGVMLFMFKGSVCECREDTIGLK
jgi:hypothetical protein